MFRLYSSPSHPAPNRSESRCPKSTSSPGPSPALDKPPDPPPKHSPSPSYLPPRCPDEIPSCPPHTSDRPPAPPGCFLNTAAPFRPDFPKQPKRPAIRTHATSHSAPQPEPQSGCSSQSSRKADRP